MRKRSFQWFSYVPIGDRPPLPVITPQHFVGLCVADRGNISKHAPANGAPVPVGFVKYRDDKINSPSYLQSEASEFRLSDHVISQLSAHYLQGFVDIIVPREAAKCQFLLLVFSEYWGLPFCSVSASSHSIEPDRENNIHVTVVGYRTTVTKCPQ